MSQITLQSLHGQTKRDIKITTCRQMLSLTLAISIIIFVSYQSIPFCIDVEWSGS